VRHFTYMICDTITSLVAMRSVHLALLLTTMCTGHVRDTVLCLRSLPSPASPAASIRTLTGFGSSSQQPRAGGPRITEAASDQENRSQLFRLRDKEINTPLIMPSTNSTEEGAALRRNDHLHDSAASCVLAFDCPACSCRGQHSDCTQQGCVIRRVHETCCLHIRLMDHR